VTLYKDAHVLEGQGALIPLEDGQSFQERSCWVDLYTAICEARKFIYVAGQSLCQSVRLSGRQPASRAVPCGSAWSGCLPPHRSACLGQPRAQRHHLLLAQRAAPKQRMCLEARRAMASSSDLILLRCTEKP
jgi:hypothetical protein